MKMALTFSLPELELFCIERVKNISLKLVGTHSKRLRGVIARKGGAVKY